MLSSSGHGIVASAYSHHPVSKGLGTCIACTRSGPTLVQQRVCMAAHTGTLHSILRTYVSGKRCCSLAHAAKPSAPDPEVIVVGAASTAVICICKEICSIVGSPAFKGWLAPVTFHPDHFAQFTTETLELGAIWIFAILVSGAASVPTIAWDRSQQLSDGQADRSIWQLVAPKIVAAFGLSAVAAYVLLPLEDLPSDLTVLSLLSLWHATYCARIAGPYNIQAKRALQDNIHWLREGLLLASCACLLASVLLQLTTTGAAFTLEQ